MTINGFPTVRLAPDGVTVNRPALETSKSALLETSYPMDIWLAVVVWAINGFATVRVVVGVSVAPPALEISQSSLWVGSYWTES